MFPRDILSEEWAKKRCPQVEHQVRLLECREMGTQYKRPSSHRNEYRNYREFYPTLKMDRTLLVHLEKGPPDFDCNLLAWTPDGSRMIATCNSSRTLRIFRYKGVQEAIGERGVNAVMKMLEKEHDVEVVVGADNSAMIRTECSLFTNDCRFLVICTVGHTMEDGVTMAEAYRNNESLELGQVLDTYTFLVVDLQDGKLSGRQKFQADKFSLSNGVSLDDNVLLVLSQQHQTITVLAISDSGGLFVERQIGASVHEDDCLHLRIDDPCTYNQTKFFTGFKQRLNTFLYKRAKEQNKMGEFVARSSLRARLRMVRAQVFSSKYILIRLVPTSGLFQNHVDYTCHPCFFVLMDWRIAKVLDVFDQFDHRFLRFFEETVDDLAHPSQTIHNESPLTFHHNVYSSEHYHRTKAKEVHGGLLSTEVCRRLLTPLPLCSSQISVLSPFLDPYLFVIEDTFFRAVLAGRVQIRLNAGSNSSQVTGPIQYYSRRTLRPLFTINFPQQQRVNVKHVSTRLSIEKLCFPCLLFHPRDPLCIGVDRSRYERKLIVILPRTEDERSIVDSYLSSQRLAPDCTSSAEFSVPRSAQSQTQNQTHSQTTSDGLNQFAVSSDTE